MRLVVGTRPEAIKLLPVADALAERGLLPTLVLTGQHHLGKELGLDRYPTHDLGCLGLPNPDDHVRLVRNATAPLLIGADLVIVQGDTSSALGGALAARDACVPVAHVEAGLRTHDPRQPWPEEQYRVAIDEFASLLFAPTAGAMENLRQEGTTGSAILTGNTAIDALVEAERNLPPGRPQKGRRPTILVTCHRRESWGEGLESIAAAVTRLAEDGVALIRFVLHPNPRVAQAMRRALQARANVELLDPCPHGDLIALLRESDLVLSDSGGIQEEAPALGIPLLVLREKTERPEAIACGNARLVGTDTARIVADARAILSDPLVHAAMSRRAFPFGDGRAAPRIADAIMDWPDRAQPAAATG
ncbi:non-hydrolyzing UDP-N-acetylglucosamine 2-epimerase [Sphingomonas lutea]|uniref:non-hydrolyzing UDP-N-acetylglucosamine 2-epimerase n=1 Tax=Sphingomonas lutea TaxID=1045317 RepID=UPI002285A3F3|nr:UDP-N-acetylglucosamine 2-epimerase (non-hydrolyzing) [Sphingomonas lutea]